MSGEPRKVAGAGNRPGRGRRAVEALRRWLRLPMGDIWDFDTDNLAWLQRKVVGGWRFSVLVWNGYSGDACKLHASALTYYSLMAIVPLLALGLSLARVFGGEEIARARISTEINRFGAQIASATTPAGSAEGEMVTEFVAQLNRYSDIVFTHIGELNFGTLGGIGLVMLLWMAVSMLNQVEHSFNQVWRARPRSLWRKIADYLTLVIIVPFLAIAATTLPIASLVAENLGVWVGKEGVEFLLRKVSPALISVVLFTIVLLVIPNTKVRFRPALAGGIVTAAAFLGWLWICTKLQVGVIKYSKLYGGFAVLPILLAWVYTSWQILLFGAEISYACQNAATYGREMGAHTAGLRARCQMALALAAEMARALIDGSPPVKPFEIARQKGLSTRLMNAVLEDLRRAGLVAETAAGDGTHVLLHDPRTLRAGQVVKAMLDNGTPPSALGLGRLPERIRRYAAEVEDKWIGSLDIAVAELAGSGTPRPAGATGGAAAPPRQGTPA